MAKVTLTWAEYDGLSDARKEELHLCGTIILGTPTRQYAAYDAEGLPIGDPETVFWNHPLIPQDDEAVYHAVKDDKTALKLKNRPVDPGQAPTDKSNPGLDREGNQIKRSRADIRYAVGVKHAARVNAYKEAVAALDPDDPDFEQKRQAEALKKRTIAKKAASR